MNGTAIVIGTFLFVTLLVLGSYYIFIVQPEEATREKLRQRIRTGGSASGLVRQTGANLLKEVERLSSIGPLHRLLAAETQFAERLRSTLQMSGLRMTAGQLLLGSVCIVPAVFLVIYHWLPMFWVSLVLGLLAGILPYATVRFVRSRRLGKFEEQFPEAVDLIARTLRAGHAFTTGLRLASEELPTPVDAEFKLLYEQQNYGMPLNDALKAFAERIPIIDARFFVTAVLTQREAGGNLAEVLDNLSAVIRERFRIKRQIRVITAHGRMTGGVLASLPPAMALYMFVRMPEHLQLLISNPLGIRMIIVAVTLQIVGAFLIAKISKVEY